MWQRFEFKFQRYRKLKFGDFQWAAGFKDEDVVYVYFQKKARGDVQEDKIKESAIDLVYKVGSTRQPTFSRYADYESRWYI
jgi:hypothetical protein